MADKKQVKMKVDRDKCIGCATCTSIYPQYFELDSEGKSLPKSGITVSEDEAEEMTKVCPVGAISYE